MRSRKPTAKYSLKILLSNQGAKDIVEPNKGKIFLLETLALKADP
jgi:hypothetical protein